MVESRALSAFTHSPWCGALRTCAAVLFLSFKPGSDDFRRGVGVGCAGRSMSWWGLGSLEGCCRWRCRRLWRLLGRGGNWAAADSGCVAFQLILRWQYVCGRLSCIKLHTAPLGALLRVVVWRYGR
jgi:hypothetical protein